MRKKIHQTSFNQIKEYEKLIELIEDYGLGLAMKEAEAEKVYEKEAALRYLENA